MIKNVLLVTLSALFLSGCFTDRGPDVWTAWIYPDKANVKRSLEMGPFSSLEQCRTASKNKLASLNLEQRGDYKCGLRCGFNEGLNTLICEKTTK